MSVIVHSPMIPTSAPSPPYQNILRPIEQPNPPYLRQSPGLILSQKSLDIITENLGSETGSDWFFSPTEQPDHYISSSKTISFSYIHGVKTQDLNKEETVVSVITNIHEERKKLTSVNYHRSTNGRFPTQSFPPPLPSISRRDGPCIQMKSHRRDGHLIVEAIPVPSQNYLHAERHNGRLRLSFVESFSHMHNDLLVHEPEQTVTEVEEEEVEEVEVRMKNKGTVVEFNVSMQPPAVITGAPKAKVRRSSLVINKFLVGPSFDDQVSTLDGVRQQPWGPLLTWEAMEWKLLFISKRRSREELLRDVQRCSDFGSPIFVFEQPCCIATTT